MNTAQIQYKSMTEFSHRIATKEDIPAIKDLMQRAIDELQRPFLSPEQVKASFELMGLDTQLIDDGTYFVIEAESVLVGCGGWSHRTTFFGANHTPGRDSSFLDPGKDAARIRAMYTHPDWIRRGIGNLIMQLCEGAAREHGFKRASMAATLAGEPLYSKCGYSKEEHFVGKTSCGIDVPLIRMEKDLTG